MLSRWMIRLRALFRGRRIEAEFDEEVRYHLERQIEQNLALGMDEEEAGTAALRELGNPLLLRDQARETWRWRRLDELAHDLRYALRGLRNNLGFSAVAILSLGFGIGVATTLFSVIDALDFRPLPYHEPDRLVWLTELTPDDYPGCPRCPAYASSAVANEWRRRTGSFAAVGLEDHTWGCLETDGLIDCPDLGLASAGLFALLGAQPALGREFLPEDTAAGAEPVVILSHETWQRRFNRDPAVIGARLEYAQDLTFTNRRSSTIIGVLPEGFRFSRDYAAWMPFADDLERPAFSSFGTSIGTVTVIGRLKPGIEPAAAEAELRAIHAAQADARPAGGEGGGAAVRPLRERIGRGTGKGRGTLFSITLIVLCISVLNVAGLLTARAAARHREFAVRMSLGASRGRLVRQLLVEGLALGLAGGVLGSMLCGWGVRIANLAFGMGRYGSAAPAAQLDLRVLAFATILASVAGVLVTVLPALGSGRDGLYPGLRKTPGPSRPLHWAGPGRRRTWTPAVLLVSQIAAALILLTAAGLLGSDYLRLRYLDIGYDPVNLYDAFVRGTDEYDAQPELMRPEAERTRERIEQIPGVRAASLRHFTGPWPAVVRLEGVETESGPVVEQVDDSYFDTLGTPIVRGRGFSALDGRGAAPVAIVNRAAAAAYGPGASALGRRVFVGNSEAEGEWLTVVGVVEDVERGDLVQRHHPRVYRPLAQAPVYAPTFWFHFRLAEARTDVVQAVESMLRQTFGHPIRAVTSHEEELGNRFMAQRINAAALNTFAAFALLLAAMGIYGSVAYAVARRTREVGIRVALGADRTSILALFARRAVVVATLGAAAGLGGSYVLTRVLQSLVSATSVTDPGVFGGAALMLAAAILLAAYLPARRATAVDPTIALRSE